MREEPDWYRLFTAVRARLPRPDRAWRDRLPAQLADASWTGMASAAFADLLAPG